MDNGKFVMARFLAFDLLLLIRLITIIGYL